MKIPARNPYTKGIMCWIAETDARRILANGPGMLERHNRRRADLAADRLSVIADMARMRALERQARAVPGLARAIKYMDHNDCDIIGRPTMPNALARSEDLYAEAHRIADRHVDQGDAAYYSSPAEHLEYIDACLAATPTGDAYSATLLASWPPTLGIPAGTGFMTEDGQVFTTASDAEAADVRASREAKLREANVAVVGCDADTITVSVMGQQKKITRRECAEAAAQWNGGDQEARQLAAIYEAIQGLAQVV